MSETIAHHANVLFLYNNRLKETFPYFVALIINKTKN